MKFWSIAAALVFCAASVSCPALAQFQYGLPIVLFGQQPDGLSQYRYRHRHHGHVRHTRRAAELSGKSTDEVG
jgi:hypothetical protein